MDGTSQTALIFWHPNPLTCHNQDTLYKKIINSKNLFLIVWEAEKSKIKVFCRLSGKACLPTVSPFMRAQIPFERVESSFSKSPIS